MNKLIFLLLIVVLLAPRSAYPSLTNNNYAIVTNASALNDTVWFRVIDSLRSKRNAVILEYDTSLFEAKAALAAFDPHWVCFVMRPQDMIAYGSEQFVRDASQLTRQLDTDSYGDALWGILTGYNAADAMRIIKTPDSLALHSILLKTAGEWLQWFETGNYFSETDTRAFWYKNQGGNTDTLDEPADCTDTLVSILNSNRVDLMVSSGHANVNVWQLHYPNVDSEGWFQSNNGALWGSPSVGAAQPVSTTNPKVYWAPGNCLIGDFADENSMVPAWIHSANAVQICGYTTETAYGEMGWGLERYFEELQDRYSFSESFFASNQAVLFDIDHATPGQDQVGLQYDRDVVALYGDPKMEARVFKTAEPMYDQSLTIDSSNPHQIHLRAAIKLNYDAGYLHPVFQPLPISLRSGVVAVDSTNAHTVTVTDDFIMYRPWWGGDSTFSKGAQYYVAFTWTSAQAGVNGSSASSISRLSSLTVFPNPVSTSATLQYSHDVESTVSISICDALGRIVARPVVGEMESSGSHEASIDTKELPPGLYSCGLNAGGAEMFAKIVVVR